MKNRVYVDGDNVTITSASLSGMSSGDPVVIGSISGVLAGDIGSDNTGVIVRKGVFDLSVKGINDSGNSAVAIGDAIYYVSGDTPKLSKKSSSGPLYGYALETIGSGSTGTINVLLVGGSTTAEDTRLDALETSMAKLLGGAGTVQELTASGAVTATTEVLELNHVSVVIAATVADLTVYAGKIVIVKDTSSGGTVAHTCTITTGTWNGTNKVATLDAPGEMLAVFVDANGDGTIIQNTGSVALS